jgi:exonuclease III
MRVVTWNLGYWTPGPYNAVANREKQWQFLLGLNADVICVQECRPQDLQDHTSSADYKMVGSIPDRWTACSAVVARTELSPMPVPRTGALLEALSGYVAVASVSTAKGTYVIASVQAPARPVEDALLSDGDHLQLRRKGGKRALYNDLAFAALDTLPKEDGFIFAGDWNTARLFDKVYAGVAEDGASSTEFFTRAAERGWMESLRTRYPDEVRTFLKPGTAAYQDDHVFTDAGTHERLVSSEVLYTLDGWNAVDLSDHAPITVDFDVAVTKPGST